MEFYCIVLVYVDEVVWYCVVEGLEGVVYVFGDGYFFFDDFKFYDDFGWCFVVGGWWYYGWVC